MTSPKSSTPPKPHLRLRPPLSLRRVHGDSMLPTLQHGQIIVVRHWFVRPRPGQVVIIENQGLSKIKRVEKLRNNEIYVLGDNSGQSTDSRAFGWLPVQQVKGVLIFHK
jgi:nickel-type superoxide dismutase maturation protease